MKQQGKTIGIQTNSASAPIERFEIIQHTMTLRDRLDMSVRRVIIGGGCQVPNESTQIGVSVFHLRYVVLLIRTTIP